MSNKKIHNDIILTLGIVILIIISFICLRPTNKGNYAIVTISGEQTAKYDLNENIQTDIISTGLNRLVIENGEAYISHADCKTNICVKTGKISKVGESIVCLPHNLIIEIVSE